jgi:hypothetical protein
VVSASAQRWSALALSLRRDYSQGAGHQWATLKVKALSWKYNRYYSKVLI